MLWYFSSPFYCCCKFCFFSFWYLIHPLATLHNSHLTHQNRVESTASWNLFLCLRPFRFDPPACQMFPLKRMKNTVFLTAALLWQCTGPRGCGNQLNLALRVHLGCGSIVRESREAPSHSFTEYVPLTIILLHVSLIHIINSKKKKNAIYSRINSQKCVSSAYKNWGWSNWKDAIVPKQISQKATRDLN